MLAGTALVLGIRSLRADLFALQAARLLAAMDGRQCIDEQDAAIAARLVFAHRATSMPAPPETDKAEESPPPEDSTSPEERGDENESDENTSPDDVVLEAVRAALPEKLLEIAADRIRSRGESRGRGRGGELRRRRVSGRPVGVVPAEQAPGGRINLLATLKTAAPWQPLRRASAAVEKTVYFERGDLRVTRFEDRTETTTVFVVDASGSQAAQRLGEVKGAIELLLADCYVRRDEVAMVMFRQADASVQLPPTRALARARKVLADIPAGGGTPLAAGIRKAAEVVAAVRRQGRTPVIVFLTDGRANVALDGTTGAAQAQEDAERAAREFRALGLRPIFVDSSKRPRRTARALAETMGAAYVPMPYADAHSLSAVIGSGRAA
jgi:magnesium chelatase subunit D